MILTTHALVGAVIGKNIASPGIVIVTSLIAHYLMDGVRHAEYFDDRYAKIRNTWWKISLDLLVGISIVFAYFLLRNPDNQTISNIALGFFFSALPDGATLIHFLSGKKMLKRLKQFHALAHRYDKNPKYSPERTWNFRNATNDILISLIALILLLI